MSKETIKELFQGIHTLAALGTVFPTEANLRRIRHKIQMALGVPTSVRTSLSAMENAEKFLRRLHQSTSPGEAYEYIRLASENVINDLNKAMIHLTEDFTHE